MENKRLTDHKGKCKIYCLGSVKFYIEIFFFIWRDSPQWVTASSFTRFLDHTQRRSTVGRNPLDEWSARRRDLYPTTHDTHNRQISMPPGGIRTHNLSRRAAADLRLRPRGHWDRRLLTLIHHKLVPISVRRKCPVAVRTKLYSQQREVTSYSRIGCLPF